jgi:hypothetical protein
MAYYYKQGKKVELKSIVEGFNFGGNEGKCNCGLGGILVLLIVLLLLSCGVGYYMYKNKK